MENKINIIKCLLIFILVGYAFGQHPVEVVSSGQNYVGKMVITCVVYKISNSSFLRNITESDTIYMRLRIRSINVNPDNNNVSALSVVWTLLNSRTPQDEFFLKHAVYACGENRVDDAAQNIVENTEGIINDMIKHVKERNE